MDLLHFMHLSFASLWSIPREPTETQGEWNSFSMSFIPTGELFSFGNNFADHGDIPMGFVRGIATGKVKSALPFVPELLTLLVPWLIYESEQKMCKKIGYICLLFLPK